MIVFQYMPIYGIQIAFKKYIPIRGFGGSPWVGLEHFIRFFESPVFFRTVFNTLGLSAYQLALGFPLSIIAALLVNQLNSKRYKKIVQTVTYAPHFISIVVLAGMITLFLSPSIGIINAVIERLGGEPIFFLIRPELFPSIFVLSGIWQNLGFSMIIYLATLSTISPELYEAATVDGASKLQKIIHIDIPGILPTVVMLFVLRIGKLMEVGWQKALLLQNSLNLTRSELISTYVYKQGILQAQFSYSTAIGLFNTVINLALILSANYLAKRLKQETLW